MRSLYWIYLVGTSFCYELFKSIKYSDCLKWDHNCIVPKLFLVENWSRLTCTTQLTTYYLIIGRNNVVNWAPVSAVISKHLFTPNHQTFTNKSIIVTSNLKKHTLALWNTFLFLSFLLLNEDELKLLFLCLVKIIGNNILLGVYN